MTSPKPYRPSNGTEGELFKQRFCDQCPRDTFDAETGSGRICEIQIGTLFYDTDQPEYPKEWIYDEAGNPTCTAFCTEKELAQEDYMDRQRDQEQNGQGRMFE